VRYLDVDGLRVSRIGLGTWQFGSIEWGYGETYARDTAPALVQRARELGITMLDTAEMYGFGRSERIIGATLAAAAAETPRDGLIVATKFMPIAPARPVVAWQAAGSRRRLGVEALDLYYVHWPNPLVAPGRPTQALRPLIDSGRILRVGVSNHSLERWRAAERALGAPVLANQVRFSLASPGPATDLVPYATEASRLIVAYSPLGQGLLAARSTNGEAPRPRGIRARDPRFSAAGRARLAPIVGALNEIATAHGATPAQVALAWVIHHPNTVAIPGARTVAQLEENAAAADLELTAEEVERLSALAGGARR
jgi:aryl-alcohol dehydrogenase-like predicted oxidoreductase